MDNLKVKWVLAPISAAILIYSATTESFEPQYELMQYRPLHEIYQQDSSAVIQTSILGIETINKIRTIQDFASKVIENMVDLEPAIIEMVDRNFWELI